MAFFHHNLSPNTMRHGYKLPAFETDFRPKTPATTPEARNKRSNKLKPEWFRDAEAPVWPRIIWKSTTNSNRTANDHDPFHNTDDPFHITRQPKRVDSHEHLAANRA